jgi:hypothetical protein
MSETVKQTTSQRVYTIESVFDVPDGPTAEHTKFLAIRAPDGQVIQLIWFVPDPEVEKFARKVAMVWADIYEQYGHPEGRVRHTIINSRVEHSMSSMTWGTRVHEWHAREASR